MAIGATSIRPRSLSLSLALHVAAAIAVVTVSALGPERLPTPLAVAAANLIQLPPVTSVSEKSCP